MRLTLTLLASFTVFRHQSDHCGLSSHQLTGSNYEAHQLLCSGSQWGHLGDQEIGRDGQEQTGGSWLVLPLKSKQSLLPWLAGLETTSQDWDPETEMRDNLCCCISPLLSSPWPGVFANIFFSPPLDTITSLRDVLPYISPSQGVSRKYFQILTPLSGDTAGVNHVNVNFHEFHIKWSPALPYFKWILPPDRLSPWASYSSECFSSLARVRSH